MNMLDIDTRFVGIHPWDLTEQNASQLLSDLSKRLDEERFLAIGEAGLDKLATASMALQVQVFEQQVKLSEQHRLPVIVHCVRAMDELLAVKKQLHPQQPWIWHGFRGKPQQARQLLAHNIYLSFGVYYNKESLAMTPANRLFLETDDTPTDIEEVLQQAAQVRGVTADALRQSIRENNKNVFFNVHPSFISL